MRRVTAVEMVTLDGVMQGPGTPDEDRRGGFDRGGWAMPYSDETTMAEYGKGMGSADLLLGRQTYEIFAAFWPKQTDGNPFTTALNETTKYVASRSLDEPLLWQNSTLLDGDATQSVRKLKHEDGRDLTILGSGVLVRSLLDHDLIDELLLLIHPIVLGSGHRLFADAGLMSRMSLDRSVTSGTGVVIATYRADGPATNGSGTPTV